MRSILILYFSGAGATKRIAELMHARLGQGCKTDIFSVESNEIPHIENYDAVIIGTPTYHAAPAKAMMNFLDAMPRSTKQTPAFIFNTRGLSALNTNRILAKKIRENNILTIMDRAYRSPASDGSLVAPFIRRFFEFEKSLDQNLDRDCAAFLELLDRGRPQGYIPKFRFGSIINAPNKMAGQLITVKIRLHKNKCAKCSLCVERCPHKAFEMTQSGYPVLDSKNCENCYRCIHHCPNTALSLSKRRTPAKQLQYKSGRSTP